MITWKNVIHYATNGNPSPPRRVEKSEKEWAKLLTPEQFRVSRKKGTEPAFSGAYCEAHEAGKYACICCGEVLFDSSLKFDSKSGWPSFTVPYHPDVIQYYRDTSYGMVRVEVCCNVCDAHLGHVFPDGPEPSGLRYCINSVSIQLLNE